jgi:hypothetical protein
VTSETRSGRRPGRSTAWTLPPWQRVLPEYHRSNYRGQNEQLAREVQGLQASLTDAKKNSSVSIALWNARATARREAGPGEGLSRDLGTVPPSVTPRPTRSFDVLVAGIGPPPAMTSSTASSSTTCTGWPARRPRGEFASPRAPTDIEIFYDLSPACGQRRDGRNVNREWEFGRRSSCRSSRAIGGVLVLGDDSQLVLRAERAPRRPWRRIGRARRGSTARRVRGLGLLVGWDGHLHRISGPALSIRDPALTRGVSHQSDGEGRGARRRFVGARDDAQAEKTRAD